ncbi:MAG: DUF4190 domain-containing protein [Chitinophagaceae bacterium]
MSFLRKLIFIGLLAIHCCITASQAAFPLSRQETTRAQKLQQRMEKAEVLLNAANHPETRQTSTEHSYNMPVRENDSGVYGILAFVTGLLGVFPAAIVLGIIGLQTNRRFQGLAAAGRSWASLKP